MTVRELFREFVAMKHRAEDEHTRNLVLAWHIEALARQNKLPSLEAVLRKPGKRQSLKEQKAMLQILSQQYGIPLRTVANG